MTTFSGYKVTSNHKTGLYPAHVRVKSPEGVVIARVQGKRGDVLRTIRMDALCEERKQLIMQLEDSRVPRDVIQSILAVPAKAGPSSTVSKGK